MLETKETYRRHTYKTYLKFSRGGKQPRSERPHVTIFLAQTKFNRIQVALLNKTEQALRSCLTSKY